MEPEAQKLINETIEEAQKLIDKIRSIPGEKLIILFSMEKKVLPFPLPFVMDISGNFESPELYSICIEEISALIYIGGSMMVCNFLENRKIIYGFILRGGTWTSLSADEIEEVYYSAFKINGPNTLLEDVGFCNL